MYQLVEKSVEKEHLEEARRKTLNHPAIANIRKISPS